MAEDYDGDGTFECTRLPAGYEDLKSGAQVKVTDAAGTVVALGQLGDGRANDTDPTEDEPYGPTRATGCTFPLQVANVPPTADIYGVEVSHRGVVQFPRAALAKPIALTLGS